MTVVVVGEAVIDLVDTPTGTRAVPGGSPANTAAALAALGMHAALRGRLSTDADGGRLRGHLQAAGVGLDDLLTVAAPSTVIRAHLEADGSARYEADLRGCADLGWQPDELRRPLPAGTTLVITGSLAASEEPGALALEHWWTALAATGSTLLAYDPNLRPALTTTDADRVRARVGRFIAGSHLVKASVEDLAWLAPDADPAQVLTAWVSTPRGPLVAVLTRGAAGAVALTRGGLRVSVPAVPVEVVDTIGAGDTFMAALCAQACEAVRTARRTDPHVDPAVAMAAWLADAATLRTALTYAAHAAALTCTKVGCQPPDAAAVRVSLTPRAGHGARQAPAVAQ